MQNPFSISKDEATQIGISVVAIALAFALAFPPSPLDLIKYPKEFISFFFVSLVTIGSGFILHEMAHKITAIHYGAWARFQMWTQGLILMLVFAIFGFLFAAPGAVYIYSNNITRRENGIISVAGPVTNLLLVLIFAVLALSAPVYIPFTFANGELNVWALGAQLNLILAIFNMLPMFPLDGSKVFAWNKLVWVAVVALCFGIGAILISPQAMMSYVFLMVIAFVFSSFLFRGRTM